MLCDQRPQRGVSAHCHPGANLDPQAQQPLDLLKRVVGIEFVGRHAGGVQPPGQVVLFEDYRRDPFQGQIGSAGQRSGTCPHQGDPLASVLGSGKQGARTGCLLLQRLGGGVTLQPADLDGLAVEAVVDTGSHAELLHRADPRRGDAHHVGGKDGVGAAAQVSSGDFFDEAGAVNAGGAGGDAGRIEAVEAAVGLDERFGIGIGRFGVAEGRFQPGCGELERACVRLHCSSRAAKEASRIPTASSTSSRVMFSGGDILTALP